MRTTQIPERPVLLTGASGGLGQVLARYLAGLGWTLRLTDRVPFPSEPPRRRHVFPRGSGGS